MCSIRSTRPTRIGPQDSAIRLLTSTWTPRLYLLTASILLLSSPGTRVLEWEVPEGAAALSANLDEPGASSRVAHHLCEETWPCLAIPAMQGAARIAAKISFVRTVSL